MPLTLPIPPTLARVGALDWRRCCRPRRFLFPFPFSSAATGLAIRTLSVGAELSLALDYTTHSTWCRLRLFLTRTRCQNVEALIRPLCLLARHGKLFHFLYLTVAIHFLLVVTRKRVAAGATLEALRPSYPPPSLPI